MKIKTSELEGLALDWAVAKAVGHDVSATVYYSGLNQYGRVESSRAIDLGEYSPSTDWSQGGPLIADGVYMLCRQNPLSPIPFETEGWIAAHEGLPFLFDGPTPLIAACRAIVAAKLGDEIDVPEELV